MSISYSLALLSVWLALPLAAEDRKEPQQPTDKERAQLLEAQRDAIIAESRLTNMANSIAVKYGCRAFKPDFTCEFAPPEVKPEPPKATPKER